MNTKIGEAIFILHVQVLFKYQMENRIKGCVILIDCSVEHSI